ncbi:MAG TPA: hypothetical protein VH143_34655 [Kofleriaceae bacterium]|nr:hypothetical protein [Kofleriaceae bacterium]
MRMGVIAVLIAACSYPQPADVEPIDARAQSLDGSNQGIAADAFGGSGGCLVPPSFPAPMFGSNQGAGDEPASGSNVPHVEIYQGLLVENPQIQLAVELIAGTMQFPGDVSTGTFDLTMQLDNDPANCGACVLVLDDFGSNGQPNDVYLAQTGTLTLTALAAQGMWTGTLSTATFERVASDGTSLDPTCMTEIGGPINMNVAFSP